MQATPVLHILGLLLAFLGCEDARADGNRSVLRRCELVSLCSCCDDDSFIGGSYGWPTGV